MLLTYLLTYLLTEVLVLVAYKRGRVGGPSRALSRTITAVYHLFVDSPPAVNICMRYIAMRT